MIHNYVPCTLLLFEDVVSVIRTTRLCSTGGYSVVKIGNNRKMKKRNRGFTIRQFRIVVFMEWKHQ